ncbi:hypothetical protein EYW49_17495 [Siculibacillus lacustris]|uniref:Uncharacterized protein n=1 Tax=Siculibacillus lacustris TaxID=1549641 RepID=A0A4Q9VI16_9HYPH|nr:hypothetical protein [Siculibacillus lacustris]TBW34715.1 hypothetical protein EYW49_17495 [Siculibacillus lacustris]
MSQSRRSSRGAVRIAVFASLAVLALSGPTLAADLGPSVAAAPIAGLPECGDDGILGTIRSRFAYGAAHVESRALELVTIEKVRQIDLSIDQPSPIARRTCAAAVALSDGTRSRLAYRIERGTGFAAPGYFGWPSNVEFCVVGHDPWHVHDGACRELTRFW